MKQLYKILMVSMFCFLQMEAQERSFKEEYTVNPDVTINVNTRHCDIDIKTWNQNKVLVEAYMVVEGEEVTQADKDELNDSWDLSIKGNSKEIDIHSRSSATIDINVLNFDAPDYTYIGDCLSDVSIGSLAILDSIDFVMPEVPLPPEPPMPPLPPLVAEFDFDAYKKDEKYLERWKKANKDYLGKDAKIKVGKNSISIKTTDANFTMLNAYDFDSDEIYEAAREAYKQAINNYKQVKRVELRQHLEEAKRKSREAKARVLEIKRSSLNDCRKEIQNVLKNRSNKKIKRYIKITAPKSAKFNMDVKYGALSIKD